MPIRHPDFPPDLLQHFPRRSILPDLGPMPRGPQNLPDLNNVQGDVFLLFLKVVENFVFFAINNVQSFKNALASYKPTTSRDVLDNLRDIARSKADAGGKRINIVQHQLALSRSGLDKLGQTEKILDAHFDNNPMIYDKEALGDRREWDPIFNDAKANGVFIVAAENDTDCNEASNGLVSAFGDGLTGVVIIKGKVRPGQFKGHEHFGFQDGVSQPALRGLVHPNKGQLQVDPGVIIMGYPGDPLYDNTDGPQRPNWTSDGSLMIFRKLEQDVIGFEDYLERNGPKWQQWLTPEQVGDIQPSLSDQEGTELFGARIIGRWKSGAPLANAPYRDDPSLADQDKANDFDYSVPGQAGPSDRFCPFSVHTRKTAPRNLDPYIQRGYLESAVIARGGIPYGGEVSQAERDSYDPNDKNYKSPRGLLFVCYQSSVPNGFFLQTTGFGNNDYFPITGLTPQKIGQDPVIGGPPLYGNIATATDDPIPQSGEISLRIKSQQGPDVDVTGFAKVVDSSLVPPPPQEFFVTSRGGEYFFVPSVSTLKALASNPVAGQTLP